MIQHRLSCCKLIDWLKVMFEGVRGKVLEAAYNVILM